MKRVALDRLKHVQNIIITSCYYFIKVEIIYKNRRLVNHPLCFELYCRRRSIKQSNCNVILEVSNTFFVFAFIDFV